MLLAGLRLECLRILSQMESGATELWASAVEAQVKNVHRLRGSNGSEFSAASSVTFRASLICFQYSFRYRACDLVANSAETSMNMMQAVIVYS